MTVDELIEALQGLSDAGRGGELIYVRRGHEEESVPARTVGDHWLSDELGVWS